MNIIRSIFIGLIALLLIAALVIGALYWATIVARKKAVKRLGKLAEDYKIPMTKTILKREVSYLNLWDLHILDKWTDAIDKKDKAEIIRLLPDAMTALKKTDLGLIFGSVATLIAK